MSTWKACINTRRKGATRAAKGISRNALHRRGQKRGPVASRHLNYSFHQLGQEQIGLGRYSWTGSFFVHRFPASTRSRDPELHL